jgi:Tfp pilus assembly protein PilO
MSKTRLWLLLTVPAVLLVLIAGWFAVVSPKRADAGALREQTSGIESNLGTLRLTLADLKRKQAELPAQQAALATLQQKIPAEPQLPPLQRAITANARSAGVTLVTTAPGAPVLLDTSGGATGSTPAPTASGSPSAAASATGIYVVPMNVVVTGEYAEMQRFLQLTEEMQRALLVQGFKLEHVDGTTSVTPGSIKLAITGQVFVSAAEAASVSTGSAASGGQAGTTGPVSAGANK